jgi:Skp family chaperone for outer membrane proteins
MPPAEGQQAFQALEQEYRQFRQGAIAESDKLTAEQFEAAYRELVAAVETVAEKEAIDLVFRFQPTADPFEAKAPAESVDRIRARTFLKYPSQVDITADVMKALNIAG